MSFVIMIIVQMCKDFVGCFKASFWQEEHEFATCFAMLVAGLFLCGVLLMFPAIMNGQADFAVSSIEAHPVEHIICSTFFAPLEMFFFGAPFMLSAVVVFVIAIIIGVISYYGFAFIYALIYAFFRTIFLTIKDKDGYIYR